MDTLYSTAMSEGGIRCQKTDAFTSLTFISLTHFEILGVKVPETKAQQTKEE